MKTPAPIRKLWWDVQSGRAHCFKSTTSSKIHRRLYRKLGVLDEGKQWRFALCFNVAVAVAICTSFLFFAFCVCVVDLERGDESATEKSDGTSTESSTGKSDSLHELKSGIP